jgi:hypothetical protein
MSTMEYRAALFFPIEGSEGWSRADVLKAVLPVLGPPTEAEDYGSGVEYFTYSKPPDPAGRSHRRVQDDVIEPVRSHSQGQWYLRYTFVHSWDDPVEFAAPARYIAAKEAEIFEKASPHLPLKPGYFASYGWYNGVDEFVPTLSNGEPG